MRWRVSPSVDEFEGEGVILHRRYRFQPQDHGFDPGDQAFATGTGKAAGTIVAIDDVAGMIELKRSRNAEWPHPDALMARPRSRAARRSRPCFALPTGSSRTASTATEPTGPSGTCFCATATPSVGWGASLVKPGEDVLDAARRLALELDTGALPIQGPPGAGKTYAGARMILDLVRARKRVGVTAQSHKTISNMLEAVVEAATKERVAVRILQKADGDVGHIEGVTQVDGNAGGRGGHVGRDRRRRRRDRLALRTTEFDDAFDVLFVDEASQMSLANAVALGTCARSIVLIGDPNQLPMVTQGVHPGGARPRRSSISSVRRRRCLPSAVSFSRRRAGCIPT